MIQLGTRVGYSGIWGTIVEFGNTDVRGYPIKAIQDSGEEWYISEAFILSVCEIDLSKEFMELFL